MIFYNKIMKILFGILFIFVSNFCCFFSCSDFVFADEICYYGRAVDGEVNFYKAPISSPENILFKVPKSYFVKILAQENDNFYKAQYMDDIFGYIKKDDMQYINKTPASPFADFISFRIFTPSGANLRSSPNHNLGATNLITTIPFLETNLLFVGNIEGEEAISYKGNLWYYCKYIKDNTIMYGYVYYAFCDMMTSIPNNNEQFEYVVPNFNNVQQSQANTNNATEMLTLGSPAQVAVIVGVSLPCILIIYFLFKPTKISMQKSSTNKTQPKQIKSKKPKKKIKRLKGSDYYELDGDFFN